MNDTSAKVPTKDSLRVIVKLAGLRARGDLCAVAHLPAKRFPPARPVQHGGLWIRGARYSINSERPPLSDPAEAEANYYQQLTGQTASEN